jgi:hypothetical protein
MKYALSVLTVVAPLVFGANFSGAQAQEASSCATPGSISLRDIPPVRADIVPSRQREIAGYGRAAKIGGCKIALVCVATDSGEAAREVARQQCVAVRDTLVNTGFTKADIATSRQNPGNGRPAGVVLFSVQ